MKNYLQNLSSIALLLLIGIGCGNKQQTLSLESEDRDNYSNILDVERTPTELHDDASFGLTDMGAWHAFGLPSKDDVAHYGAFTGPLVMNNRGSWVAPALLQLQVKLNGDNVDLSKADASFNYYPGKLSQKLTTKEIEISMDMIFDSKRSSILAIEIKNLLNSSSEITVGWKGDNYFMESVAITQTTEGISFDMSQKNGERFLFVPAEPSKLTVKENSSYNLERENAVTVKAGKSYSFDVRHIYTFSKDEELAVYKERKGSNRDHSFKENKARWDRYITNTFSGKRSNDLLEKDGYKNVAVKAVMTLAANWRSAAGDLPIDGVFPSASAPWFYGFWSWDTWKIAVGIAHFDTEIAKNSIRSMFAFQDDRGMIADCVYFDSSENNWRDTKAPLSAWAVWEIYKIDGDISFLKELLPKVEKYHKWWYRDRDFNGNGICEFGSTDGTEIAARWESGMDNAVRFDDVEMVKIDNKAYSLNVESVDLNGYLAKEKEFLSLIYKAIAEDTEESSSRNKYLAQANIYSEDAKKLAKRVRDQFFSKETGFFHDYRVTDGTLITDCGPEGWTPLWTSVASQEQADQVAIVIDDSSKFNTKMPFPTIAADNPKFNPEKGYWRGPVWIDQAYFGIKGLRNYGHNDLADKLTIKLFENGEGILGDRSIRETYHPITGKGLNANHFSWSSAHLLLLLVE